MNKHTSPQVTNRRFAVVNGKTITVRDPRPIELAGLAAKFSIKPHTTQEERDSRQAVIRAAQHSLQHTV